jgi:hypothetical protein
MGEEAAERRDDPTSAALGHPLASVIAPERDRRAVEDDEKLTPSRCRV